jgi:hypothetical protein
MLVKEAAEKRPKVDPLERPDYLEADAQALRAVAVGRATEDQQRRAMDFIVNEICATYDMPFRPTGRELTAFACGKQHVGQTIVWLLKTAPTKTDPAEIASRRAMEEQGDVST